MTFLNNRISKGGGIVLILLVLGVLTWQYFGVSKEEVTEDETADWQTYRNEELGFEIKYPNDWEFLVNDPFGKAYPSFRDKKYDGSFEWPGLTIDWPPLEILETESRIFKLESAKNEVITISFSDRKDKRVAAVCTLYGDLSVLDICNQMLSTFRFLE